jgi:hypothetical protein
VFLGDAKYCMILSYTMQSQKYCRTTTQGYQVAKCIPFSLPSSTVTEIGVTDISNTIISIRENPSSTSMYNGAQYTDYRIVHDILGWTVTNKKMKNNRFIHHFF